MDLYYGRNSGNSARAVFGLFEAGARWEPRLIDPKAGENRAAGYLAVNPMGKIPALVDGAFHLWESNAINWYAAEEHPDAKLLPTTAAGRASVQRWLFFQAAHVSPACVPVYRATNERVRAYWGGPADPAAAATGAKELARFLPVLDTALEGRDWLETTFSLADIAYAPHLAFLAEGGFDFAPYPRLKGWLDRLWGRPAWRRTLDLVLAR
jgi:glutathione S-transferase